MSNHIAFKKYAMSWYTIRKLWKSIKKSPVIFKFVSKFNARICAGDSMAFLERRRTSQSRFSTRGSSIARTFPATSDDFQDILLAYFLVCHYWCKHMISHLPSPILRFQISVIQSSPYFYLVVPWCRDGMQLLVMVEEEQDRCGNSPTFSSCFSFLIGCRLLEDEWRNSKKRIEALLISSGDTSSW